MVSWDLEKPFYKRVAKYAEKTTELHLRRVGNFDGFPLSYLTLLFKHNLRLSNYYTTLSWIKALAVLSNLSPDKACWTILALRSSETMLNLQSFFLLEYPGALSLLLNGALGVLLCLVLRVCCLSSPCALSADSEF